MRGVFHMDHMFHMSHVLSLISLTNVIEFNENGNEELSAPSNDQLKVAN